MEEEREMEREMAMEEVSGGAFICLFVWFLWEGVGLGWVGGGKEEAPIVCVAKASTNALRTGAESQRSRLRTRPCTREHARRILRRR